MCLLSCSACGIAGAANEVCSSVSALRNFLCWVAFLHSACCNSMLLLVDPTSCVCSACGIAALLSVHAQVFLPAFPEQHVMLLRLLLVPVLLLLLVALLLLHWTLLPASCAWSFSVRLFRSNMCCCFGCCWCQCFCCCWWLCFCCIGR